jgi:hypothetical protein
VNICEEEGVPDCTTYWNEGRKEEGEGCHPMQIDERLNFQVIP